MCLGCYPETPAGREAYNRIEGFLTIFPEAEFGFAHIAFGDDNIADCDIDWCLTEGWKNYRVTPAGDGIVHWEQLPNGTLYQVEEWDYQVAARCYLKWLRLIPEDVRLGERAEMEWVREVLAT